MNPEHIRQRIEDLKSRGIVSPEDEARIERDLAAANWADVEIFLNQLEIEARFRSWRPIIRLAMFSSLISALILMGVVVWVATTHPEQIEALKGRQSQHETEQSRD